MCDNDSPYIDARGKGLETRSREHRLFLFDGSIMVGVAYINSVHMHRPQNGTKLIIIAK